MFGLILGLLVLARAPSPIALWIMAALSSLGFLLGALFGERGFEWAMRFYRELFNSYCRQHQ